jgi:hypothetical protein
VSEPRLVGLVSVYVSFKGGEGAKRILQATVSTNRSMSFHHLEIGRCREMQAFGKV